MSDSESNEQTAAERSVELQQRYVVPVLLVVAIVVVAITWAAGGIQWWIAVPVLALGLLAVGERVLGSRR